MSLSIQHHTVEFSVVRIEDRFDASQAALIREELKQLTYQGYKNFVVDLRSVSFIDSAGMGLLATFLRASRGAGGDVCLLRPTTPSVQRLLQMTRFDHVFQLYDSLDEVIRCFPLAQ